MGGYGSGNWARKRRYQALETVPELIVTDLNLTHGTLFARPRDTFHGGELPYTYLLSGNALILFAAGEEDEREPSTVIQLDKTACHFGSGRSWFICPNKQCNRRVSSLFVKNHTIACRHCQGLNYESQYGGEAEKALGRIRKFHHSQALGKQKHKIDVASLYRLYSDVLSPLEKIGRVA